MYLTLFFDPSMAEVTYNGVYQPMRGIEMSKAYASALDISFEVRGGLFVRQVHHWAALMFAAAIMVHLARIFFTGAFRRPREANWVIGSLLLILAMFEGFFGYSLPDDLLSGTGIRAALSSITLGIPLIGTWLHWALFGGDFPGDILIPRLYSIHILIFPGIMLALIGVHLAMVWFQKHTQFPGPGRTEKNVVGVRVMPVFAVKSGAFFAMTTGILGLMGGLLQINPIWQLGPYKPSQVSAGSQPDFYLMWTDGLIRIWPAWELYIGNYTVPAAVAVAVIMGVVFAAADRLSVHRAEGDRRPRPPQSVAAAARCAGAHRDRRDGHRVLHRADVQRDERHYRLQVPSLAQCDDLDRAYRHGGASCDRLLHHLPVVCGSAAQRPRGARARHRDRHHQAAAHGAYIELHQPLGPLDEHGHPVPLEYQGAAVPKRMNKLGSVGAPGTGSLLYADPASEHQLLTEAAHTAERKALNALREYQQRNGSSNGHRDGPGQP